MKTTAATLLLLSTTAVGATVSYPYSVKDIFSFNRVGQVVNSPNSDSNAFLILQAQQTSKVWRWQSALYLKTQDNKPRLVKRTYSDIASPTWSANGTKLYYLAKGQQTKSLWVYHLKNHKSNKLIEVANDIQSFKLSPTQKNVVALVAKNLSATAKKSALINPNRVTNDRLYLVSFSHQSYTIKPLTAKNISISQFSGNNLIDGGFDWSPNGQSIAYAYQPQSGATTSNQARIAIVNLLNNKTITLPYTQHYVGLQPHFSPNGLEIAFHASGRNPALISNNPYAEGRVCVTNVAHWTTKCLANTFNQAPSLIGWNKNSNVVYVADDYKTDGPQIYALSLDGSKPAKLLSNKRGFIDLNTISFNQQKNTLDFSWQNVNQSPGAYIASLNHFRLRAIAFPNTADKHSWGQLTILNWHSKDGLLIQGEMLLPKHFNKNKRYPLIVIPHGGPINVWAKRYLGGCEEYGRAMVPDCMANLLSQGYVVFKPNYRGSTGYGKAYRTANVGDLGGGDFQDIMSGVDVLIKKGIADPKRLAIFGWSYGGYLTAWSISQSHRFKAAIDGDGLTDFISFTGTTDIPWYLVQYLGGTFWQKRSLYMNRSPISDVNHITTPVLILEGEKDRRVPPGQAYELYHDLRFQHKTTRLLISPGQGHVPQVAEICAHLINAVDRWLARYLGGSGQ